MKHLTTAHLDESMAELIEECGLEGYGFYWVLCELIGQSMEKGSDRCELTYSLTQWSRKLYSHHNRVGKYLGKLGVMGRVEVTYIEGKVRVSIPKLLKYRDEYNKKSGQTPDTDRTVDRETETEGKTETESTKPPFGDGSEIADSEEPAAGLKLVKTGDTELQSAGKDMESPPRTQAKQARGRRASSA